jgi:A/G-specific adenine glycosylase
VSVAASCAPEPAVLAELLLPWYASHARDLPWRRTGTTPWGVLVSEFMLQQTPVTRVAPVWIDWLARWPAPSALAEASQADVLRAWGKLGYPRRALRLHTAATTIAVNHGDRVPDELDALLALPGVGAYTARAVLAFGHGRRAAVVDTNVRRVIARVVRGDGEAGSARIGAELADADLLLPAAHAEAARVSAALMELGALICTATRPRCAGCPLRAHCAWHAAGSPAYTGRTRRVQRFAGTDRQVRGRLLDVLRDSPGPVSRAELDPVWSQAAQRERCLDSLLADGLIERGVDGRFALPGEGRAAPANGG